MKIPIASQAKTYLKQMEDWKRRKGPEGGGGAWNAKEGKYGRAPEPQRPDGLSAFETKVFDAIRSEVLK